MFSPWIEKYEGRIVGITGGMSFMLLIRLNATRGKEK